MSTDGMQQELDKRIERAPENLKEVLCDAYNRYYVVDNTGTKEQRKQHASFVLGKIQVSFTFSYCYFFLNPKNTLKFMIYYIYEPIVSTYLPNLFYLFH